MSQRIVTEHGNNLNLSLKMVQRKSVLVWLHRSEVSCSFAENDLQLSESGSESDDWARHLPSRGRRITLCKGKGNRAQAHLNIALSHFLSALHIYTSAGSYGFAASTPKRNDPNISSHTHTASRCLLCACVWRGALVWGFHNEQCLITPHAHMQLNMHICKILFN